MDVRALRRLLAERARGRRGIQRADEYEAEVRRVEDAHRPARVAELERAAVTAPRGGGRAQGGGRRRSARDRQHAARAFAPPARPRRRAAAHDRSGAGRWREAALPRRRCAAAATARRSRGDEHGHDHRDLRARLVRAPRTAPKIAWPTTSCVATRALETSGGHVPSRRSGWILSAIAIVGHSRVFSTCAATTPAFTPLRPSLSNAAPKTAPFATWRARPATGQPRRRVTSPPSNRTSEYGVPASLRSTVSLAAHATAAAAPAAAPLTYSSSQGTLT